MGEGGESVGEGGEGVGEGGGGEENTHCLYK